MSAVLVPPHYEVPCWYVQSAWLLPLLYTCRGMLILLGSNYHSSLSCGVGNMY